MRKLLLTAVLFIAGCASRGYRGTEGGYTLYRSRMMTPQGVLSDRHLDRPFGERSDPDESQYLSDSYSSWQP